MKQTDDNEIQDAIVVDDSENSEDKVEEETSTPQVGGADVLLNLEQLIKTHITNIDKIKEDLKIKNEMLNDILVNDETYRKHDEDVKAATKIKTATKQQILKQPQAAALNSEVKEMKTGLKELNVALSDYLREYGRMAGVNEIEGEDGLVREIVLTAKLIKRIKS